MSDYKKRALDHQRKEAKMKSLRKKAKDRNPDEFYYKMVNTHLEDGEHVEEEKKPGERWKGENPSGEVGR